jgi:hypothetical protein
MGSQGAAAKYWAASAPLRLAWCRRSSACRAPGRRAACGSGRSIGHPRAATYFQDHHRRQTKSAHHKQLGCTHARTLALRKPASGVWAMAPPLRPKWRPGWQPIRKLHAEGEAQVQCPGPDRASHGKLEPMLTELCLPIAPPSQSPHVYGIMAVKNNSP